jgi:prepilin-type N-terminal cleavage/methylation domain-containing protein
LPARALATRQRRRQDGDEGFTLLELVFSMLVLAIVAVISFALIDGLTSDQQVEQASLGGLSQSELASRIFTEYLGSAEQGTLGNICQIPATTGPCLGSATTYASLTFDSLIGLTTAAGASQANWEPAAVQVTVVLVPGPRTGVDELDVYFDYGLPDERLIAAYDIEPPGASDPIFTYYWDSGGSLAPEPVTEAAANPSSVLAVGLDITFVAPPGSARVGSAAEGAAPLHTITYLRNLSMSSS